MFAPTDISSLIIFRIVMGVVVLWSACEFFHPDTGKLVYATLPFRFTYHGFAWVQPWPAPGLQIHFSLLALFAVFLTVGFLTRISALVLFLGFTYVFLLEKADYLNHSYLICLLLFLLIFLPTNRRFAVDAWLDPTIKSDVIPAWGLWLVRFQVGLPYLYGGIVKLNGDWLRGQPMQLWLAQSPWRGVLGPVAAEHWLALLFSWGGMLFDLGVVPLLLWRRTRPYAFAVAVVFHLMNAFMFHIGVFPWMMIGATLIFFPPDWPRRLLGQFTSQPLPARSPPGEPSTSPSLSVRQKLVLAALLLYTGFHLLFPFRCLLYPGNVLWTEEGHRFAWQMMLRTKKTGMQFVVVHPTTGEQHPANFKPYLTHWQFNKMARDPEMIREFAHFLREQYQEKGEGEVEVHVVAICSLNGRKPQLLIDPKVDLSRQPRTIFPSPWIVPLTEPFRWKPWQSPHSRARSSEQ